MRHERLFNYTKTRTDKELNLADDEHKAKLQQEITTAWWVNEKVACWNTLIASAATLLSSRGQCRRGCPPFLPSSMLIYWRHWGLGSEKAESGSVPALVLLSSQSSYLTPLYIHLPQLNKEQGKFSGKLWRERAQFNCSEWFTCINTGRKWEDESQMPVFFILLLYKPPAHQYFVIRCTSDMNNVHDESLWTCPDWHPTLNQSIGSV